MTYPAQTPEVMADVLDELGRAMKKFPTWPSDPLHAIGVVNEEVGELSKAVLQEMYEPHKQKKDAVYKEAVQACAMLLRFLASYQRYDWVQGKQHKQSPLLSDVTNNAHAIQRDNIRPTYYVQHPDGSFTQADPQP